MAKQLRCGTGENREWVGARRAASLSSRGFGIQIRERVAAIAPSLLIVVNEWRLRSVRAKNGIEGELRSTPALSWLAKKRMLPKVGLQNFAG